jgi:hypothetical protein
MYPKCLGKFQEFAKPKQEKKFKSKYVRKHFFGVQAPNSADLNTLDFYLGGHIKTVVYPAPNSK